MAGNHVLTKANTGSFPPPFASKSSKELGRERTKLHENALRVECNSYLGSPPKLRMCWGSETKYQSESESGSYCVPQMCTKICRENLVSLSIVFDFSVFTQYDPEHVAFAWGAADTHPTALSLDWSA